MKPAAEAKQTIQRAHQQHIKQLYAGRTRIEFDPKLVEFESCHKAVQAAALRIGDAMKRERRLDEQLMEKRLIVMGSMTEKFLVEDVSPVWSRLNELVPQIVSITEDKNLTPEGQKSAILELAEETSTWLDERYQARAGELQSNIVGTKNRTPIPPYEHSGPLSVEFSIERVWEALEKIPQGERSMKYLADCKQGPTTLLMLAVRSQIGGPVEDLVPQSIVDQGIEEQWRAIDPVAAYQIKFLEVVAEQTFLLHHRAGVSLQALGFSRESMESWKRQLRIRRDEIRAALLIRPNVP